VEKYGTVVQVTDYSIMWRMRFAWLWMTTVGIQTRTQNM